MTENSKMFNLWRMLFSGVIAAGFSFQLFWSLYFHQASKSWQAVEARVVSIENEPKSAELRKMATHVLTEVFEMHPPLVSRIIAAQ